MVLNVRSKPNSDWRAVRFLQDPMRLHQLLRRRLLLPKALADAAVSASRIMSSPQVARRRRQLASQLMQSERTPIAEVVDREQGFRFFSADDVGGRAAIQEARQVFDDHRQSGKLPQVLQRAAKNFLVAVAENEELLDYPQLGRFIFGPDLLNMATAYLGSVPILSSARIFWTQPNDTTERSQRFHRDAEGKRQLKFFFNVTAVDSSSGPLTFIPAPQTENALRALGRSARRGKLDDSELERCGALSESRQLLGPAGAAVALDTSRCLHFGSRGNKLERLLLMVQFTPLSAPRARIPHWGKALQPYLLELSEAQLLALNRHRRLI